MNQESKELREGRLKRALELKCQGLTVAQISGALKSEGYKMVSVRTVSRLLNGAGRRAFADALMQKQLETISLVEDSHPELALKYRDRILEKMIPRKVESKNETRMKGEHKVAVRGDIRSLLSEYEQVFRGAGDPKKKALREDDPGEQVDTGDS